LSDPPLQRVYGAEPTAEVLVYAVEQVGAVSITEDVSELTQLEYNGVTVMVLAATPYAAEGEDAVTVNVFFSMTTDPDVYVNE
jgi:hypothetical protein